MEKGNKHHTYPALLLVDKPAGMTSFDVIRVLRKVCGVRKMGHAGTLDPRATGLLVVGVGEGTKRLKEIIGMPKTYRATVRFGERRDTGDLEGRVVEEVDTPLSLSEEEAQRALASLTGVLPLPVPRYSAVKRGGVPLYRRARRGEAVEVPVRPMEVRRARLISFRREEGGLRVHAEVEWEVGSGTYIRALAEEWGRRVGVPATLAALRRTRVGPYRVEGALRMEAAEAGEGCALRCACASGAPAEKEKNHE